jgi:hypothetical protein
MGAKTVDNSLHIGSTDGAVPSVLNPRGVAFEQLHGSAQFALITLFPKERGRLLITLLLQFAVVQAVDVPDKGLVRAAVLFLPSIEAFAREHGWGKDTALRYIDTLEALGFLRRYRHAHHTEFHIFLEAWSPAVSGLTALDALIRNGRDKVQQLAHGVKDRYSLLYGSPHTWSSLFLDLEGTLVDIQEQLTHRVSITKRTLLQIRTANLLERLRGPEGNVLQKGRLSKASRIPGEL